MGVWVNIGLLNYNKCSDGRFTIFFLKRIMIVHEIIFFKEIRFSMSDFLIYEFNIRKNPILEQLPKYNTKCLIAACETNKCSCFLEGLVS